MTKRPESDTRVHVNHEDPQDVEGLPRRDLLKLGAAGLGLAVAELDEGI